MPELQKRLPGTMRRLAAAALMCTALAAKPGAQTAAPLTNADVIRMVAAKLGDTVIITAIEKAPGRTFDLSVDGLIALKQAGVSDAVIVAMQKVPPEAKPLAPPAPAVSTPAPVPAPVVSTPMPVPAPRPAPAAPAPPGRPTPQEPDGVLEAFRVNLATGELIPLERTKAKQPQWSAYKTVHLEGAASPITFKYGQPLVFAVRSFTPIDKLRAEKNDRYKYRIEHLAVKDGRRYASYAYDSVEIEPYGEPKYGLSGRTGKNDLPAYAYLLTPRARLPPGQY